MAAPGEAPSIKERDGAYLIIGCVIEVDTELKPMFVNLGDDLLITLDIPASPVQAGDTIEARSSANG